jgi:hypothetical protein
VSDILEKKNKIQVEKQMPSQQFDEAVKVVFFLLLIGFLFGLLLLVFHTIYHLLVNRAARSLANNNNLTGDKS